MRASHLAPTLCVALLIVGCGARTGLLVGFDEDSGVGPADADVPADADILPDVVTPDCGPPLEPGEVRARIPGIVGRVAIDDEGVIYAPATGVLGLDLVAIDPCGDQILWQAMALPTGRDTANPQAHLYRDDEVLLTADSGPLDGTGFARFRRDGEQLLDFPLDGNISNLIGIADEYGPVLRSYDGDDGVTYLSRLSPEREDRVDIYGTPDSPTSGLVWPNECAIFGRQITCYDRAFDLESLEERWYHEPRIIDGTLRHVIPPALVGEQRFVTIRYGISTYDLVVRALADGSQVWSEPLARSDIGQTGLLTGSPIVGQSGRIISYINANNAGVLRAHLADGTLLWDYSADANEQVFFYYATHAAGAAGVIYLAVGSSIHAITEEAGAQLWRRDDLGEFHGRCVTLSPNGDLVALNDDNELTIIATDSRGPAHSSWPAPGGGPRNSNANL